MAKKKKPPPEQRATAATAGLASGGPMAGLALPAGHASHADRVPRPGSPAVPAEVAQGDFTVLVLAFLMFLAPALGVPHEEMLQDTLKSMVVSFATLGAGLLFFWQQRRRSEPLRWHVVLFLPLLLSAYALGSMAWSHTYLAGVEAIRWFIFSLLFWLGLNTLTRERLPMLVWGIHGGAVVASLWTALQFWFDMRLFPQGPNPASTFVNRNFFAEFTACTLPFSALLLAHARHRMAIAGLAFSSGFVILAILMTGTRGALGAVWLQLGLLLPLIGWRYRAQFAFPQWGRGQQLMAVGILLATVVLLGLVKTGNDKLAQEGQGLNALERALSRTASIKPGDASLNLRLLMWKSTARIIEDRPLTGVGAGAWESEIPLYQEPGAQLETDYYAHNEYLQLLAEYGLAGWIFLLLLAAYLAWAALSTWRDRSAQGQAEAPLRALLLCSLLAFMVVSNVGFPWRMAATGALFALCLGALAASDARLHNRRGWPAARLAWQPARSRMALAGIAAALVLAMYISRQAAESEHKIIRATRLALTISASGTPNHPRWDRTRTELLQLIRDGIAINPHYRKITPMVADHLAQWGDWKNATWIWESVLSSRPHVVAILGNVARGHAAMGDPDKALAYVARARKIQPTAPSVLSLEIALLGRMGQASRALALAREAMARGHADQDLLSTTFLLAVRATEFALAIEAMEQRIRQWPESRANGHLQLASLYASKLGDPDKALAAYRQALAMTPESGRAALRDQIPAAYQGRLDLADPVPESAAGASAQRSSISR